MGPTCEGRKRGEGQGRKEAEGRGRRKVRRRKGEEWCPSK